MNNGKRHVRMFAMSPRAQLWNLFSNTIIYYTNLHECKFRFSHWNIENVLKEPKVKTRHDFIRTLFDCCLFLRRKIY